MQFQLTEKNTFLELKVNDHQNFKQRSNSCPKFFDLNGLLSIQKLAQKERFAPRIQSIASVSTECTDSESCGTPKKASPWRKLDEFAHKNALDESSWTTVMIRNIPNKYTQDQLLDEIFETGCDVDFLHLPMVTKSQTNMGYAFANFSSPEEAFNFMTMFDGHVFIGENGQPAEKRGAVNYARLQGLQENIAFYEGRRIAKTDRKPWIKQASRRRAETL
jgi:hypothetical protein